MVSLCNFCCTNYIILKKTILFIVMFSHIYLHIILFEKTHLYRTKNKYRVYWLNKVVTYKIILKELYAW